MDSSSLESRPRRQESRNLPSAGAPRRQRTLAVVHLVRNATLGFVARFLPRPDPTARDLTETARAAGHALERDHVQDLNGEKNRLAEVRQHTAHLVTLLEILLDQRRLRRWLKDDPEAREVRMVGQRYSIGQAGYRHPEGPAAYAEWLDHPDPGVVANTIICLIHQANYLLDRQINLLRQGFRLDPDAASPAPGAATAGIPLASDPAEPVPPCPKCGKSMILRTARRGSLAGQNFWGCSAYPRCGGMLDYEKAADFRPRP